MRPFDELLAGVYSSTVSEVSVLIREVRVKIGVLSRPVALRVFFNGRNPEPFSCDPSAWMNPVGAPDIDPFPIHAASETEALRLAVRALTQNYEEAIRAGRMPDESWLIPRES